MKVIVTGSSGFIGQHVIPKLLERGCEVILLNRSSKLSPDLVKKNTVISQYEIGSENCLDSELIQGADALLHLAWSHVNEINSDAHLTKNTPDHFEFVKRIVDLGVRNIFVLGSCYEYGMCEGEISETHPVKPVTNYGLAKNELRLQLERLQNETDFNLMWARLFYVFGTGQVSTSIYSQLMEALESGKTEFGMSKGDQKLDYLGISEVAEIIIKILFQRRNIGCVNICSGKPVILRELVQSWIAEKRSSIKIVTGVFPTREYEPKNFWGNRTYLDQVIG